MYVNWTAISALGTWAAIIVALFGSVWINRQRLKVSTCFTKCVIRPNVDDDIYQYIEICMTNMGKTDIVILAWGIKVSEHSEISSQFFDLGSQYKELLSPKLPHRLHPGDIFLCGIPKKCLSKELKNKLYEGLIQSDDPVYIWAKDSSGKKHSYSLGKTTQECIEI